jgi:hypothetical protein
MPRSPSLARHPSSPTPWCKQRSRSQTWPLVPHFQRSQLRSCLRPALMLESQRPPRLQRPPVVLLAGTQTSRPYLPEIPTPPRLRRGLYRCRLSQSLRFPRSLRHWRISDRCVFLGTQRPPRQSRRLRRNLPPPSSLSRMGHPLSPTRRPMRLRRHL